LYGRKYPTFPDRIIAATAQFHGVPVLSRDGRTRAANIKTIW
jgi:PIN domain nuclease of toxin-antitoxin system